MEDSFKCYSRSKSLFPPDSLQKSYLPIPQSVMRPRLEGISGLGLSLTPHPDHIQRGEGEPKGPLGLCHGGRASLEEVPSCGKVWNSQLKASLKFLELKWPPHHPG